MVKLWQGAGHKTAQRLSKFEAALRVALVTMESKGLCSLIEHEGLAALVVSSVGYMKPGQRSVTLW